MEKNYFKKGDRAQKSLKGFTLIEAIVYVGIFVMVATLGATVFDFALRSKRTSGRMGDVYMNANRTMQQIVDRVHAASYIKSASGNTLVLWMNDNTSTTFSLVNNAVTQQEGVGLVTTTTPSTLFVSDLTFTAVKNPAPSATSTQIILTVGYNNEGVLDSATTYTLRTTVLPL